MTTPRKHDNNTGTLSFDLADGLVRFGNEARILLPVSALLSLWGAANPSARRVFGRALGDSIGRTAQARLTRGGPETPGSMLDTSPEGALSELAAAWALAGLGALGMERWGRALVFVVEGSPLGTDGDELCEIALEGAIGAASGRSVRVVRIDRAERSARFLVGNQAAAAKVRSLCAEGRTWAEALLELHASRGEA